MDRLCALKCWAFIGIGAALLAGCSKPDVVVSDGEGGTVKVSKDRGNMTFEDKDGQKTTVETDAEGGKVKVESKGGDSTYESGGTVTEADLGLPFYPGSKEKPNGSVKTDTPDGKSVVAMRTTPDAPSKVVEFYKPKLKDATTQSTGSGETTHSMLFGKTESGAEVVVTAVQPKGAKETDVSVTVMTKKAK